MGWPVRNGIKYEYTWLSGQPELYIADTLGSRLLLGGVEVLVYNFMCFQKMV